MVEISSQQRWQHLFTDSGLYILWYYLGGSAGITAMGYGFKHFGWSGVTGLGLTMLALPLGVGIYELRTGH